MSFDTVLDQYRKYSFSERDKGDRFERLMQAYLLTDPKYAYQFKKVWLWGEFPGRKDFGGQDTGIDLVALTFDGDYWAVQCKFYQDSARIDKGEVDSFLATSSREFKDENLRTVGFAHRLWISTTNNWGSNATEAIKNQNPPVSRINLFDLAESPVDWDKLANGITGELSRTPKKQLRPHQQEALEKAHEHFKTSERGKLIMACGTGKTFASLRIAENETDGKGLVLFLVPSISLLSQTLREWSADAKEPINPIAICSDPKVSKKKARDEDMDLFSVVDLALPASTDVKTIVRQFQHIRAAQKPGMTVVFSTYQSIEVIAEAQKELLKSSAGYGVFDMIICDEAHRTTGVALAPEDESAFTKVHNNQFIQGRKRLYMTATPRLYSDDAKSKAAQADALLCSMDDPRYYGEEIYRIGFGEAVEQDLLTDYKVLILTLSDKDVPEAIQKMIADENQEISSDDASKLIGCINALSKQILGDHGIIQSSDPEPMRRAVAFCQNIAVSKRITDVFNDTSEVYLDELAEDRRSQMVSVASKHIDGSMTAPERDDLLGWLKAYVDDERECRVLTNVRCLSEGVDVPSLDAVMFLSARNSQVDVVQSVGRVMRKAPGKKYGYIIIPVVVPSNVEPEKALNDNERFKVVWTVLNALRAHDDRFNATVNKIELNKNRPEQILIGTVGSGESGEIAGGTEDQRLRNLEFATQLSMQFEQLQGVIFARMVEKVGDRRYWEQWAKSVAEIAERQVVRINRLIREGGKHKEAFENFLAGLRKNINPSIAEQEAIEMLSQHIITKPVFEALFEGYSFVKNNPISVSMQTMLDLLEEQAIEKDTETLERFYESVRMRAAGIDNAEGRQRVIIELYDKFFKTAFPKMVERLGIVYTPVEIVDFIIHSVEDILQKEFGRSLSDENVHLLDPFTGTGTFVTRLLQSGLIRQKDLLRKYRHEIHANEIVLLAYYIAAVNIENAFYDAMEDMDYESFEGICLTDTFQLGETDESQALLQDMFPKNSERVTRQKKAPVRVIIGNPPYSVGQRSANDNAQNQKYEILDERIADTYAANTKATNKNSLYDSYFKAFRWGTDRLEPEQGGVICFVSNGAWIDSNAADGFRKSIEKEFSSVYIFNLRGNQRTSGELSRKEGGKIFGSGSRTPIAITLLVKNPNKNNRLAEIYYHDIGDYLNREEKLKIVQDFGSIASSSMNWTQITPNDFGDWINQRNGLFETFIELTPATKFSQTSISVFTTNSNGLQTNRDAWVYNFSKNTVVSSISALVEKYNSLLDSPGSTDNYIEHDDKIIKWSSSLVAKFESRTRLVFSIDNIWQGVYRPFCKQFVYRQSELNHRPYQLPKFFPTPNVENRVICVSGVGATKDFSVLIASSVPDVQMQFNGQCFPFYYYEERPKSAPSLFDQDGEGEYVRRDGVTDFILERAKKMYGSRVTKEDIFYYVYGFLHSPEYRTTFADDLKKMLPRLPLVDELGNFWKFSKAGRDLAELHVNYETVPPYPGVTVKGAESGYFRVEKMRFPKKDQKQTILFNSRIAIENIPDRAYEYVVNGKSAIEWIMERYQVTVHKDSGIENDPNDWADEVGNPRYILDLLLSVINVSVQTMDIVDGLPKVSFDFNPQ